MTLPLHSRRRRPLPRGSTLLMVTVLLAILAVIGVAAASLGSRERINAAAKGRRDVMAACANAARLVVWAEVARYGSARLTQLLTEQRITLADGTFLAAPSHYRDVQDLQVIELTRNPAPLAGGSEGGGSILGGLTTNFIGGGTGGSGGLGGATAYNFTARCRDATGRETEVEFSTAFIF